ncbi:MAG: ABC transporter substrate-binding protein [Betaproteobacteria bacterium]
MLVSLPAIAQRLSKAYRIGFIGISQPTPDIVRISLEPFKQGLRDRGWIEGENVVIEERWAHGKSDRFSEIAAELVQKKVDVIVTVTSEAALGVRKATASIPIVGTFLGDPVKRGLIQSYARPGTNVTGLTSDAGGLSLDIKALEHLKQAVPGATRITVLVNPKSAAGPQLLEIVKVAAISLRIEVSPVEVGAPEHLERTFIQMGAGPANALLVLSDAMFFTHRFRIGELATRHRQPSAAAMPGFADAGGLMAYVADFSDSYRRVAGYVDLILKGASPAELPVEQPTKFELTVNLKTARAIGLKLPYVVLLRADRVID